MVDYLIDGLKSIGITGREAEVYLALLHKKELTAPEIAKISTVSLNKIYEVLQNLVKKNMCNEYFKDGLKVFSSIEPKIALENILSTFEYELSKKRLLVKEFEDRLMSLYKNHGNNEEPLDYIEVISDLGQLKERFLNLELNAKKEILVFEKPPYAQAFEENFETQSEMPKTMSIKGLYEYKEIKTQAENDRFVKMVKTFMNIGEEARLIKELPMKLAIFDETVSMISLADKISLKSKLTSLIINHAVFSKAIRLIFDTYWNMGMTLNEYKEQVLFEEEQEIKILQ
jgi:sugar-specific transcriptional regulator TrmB